VLRIKPCETYVVDILMHIYCTNTDYNSNYNSNTDYNSNYNSNTDYNSNYNTKNSVVDSIMLSTTDAKIRKELQNVQENSAKSLSGHHWYSTSW